MKKIQKSSDLKISNLEQGFTLIELVVVIVILGILSAVAVPKFVNLTDDSRRAVMEGLMGSIKSATTMVHSKALIANKTTGTETVEADGVFYSVVNSYPATHNVGTGSGDSVATAAGIIGAIDKTIPLITVQLTGNGQKSTTFSYSNLGSGCRITYLEALSSNEPPVITFEDSGC